MHEYFQVFKRIAELEIGVHCFVSFDDDDGTINLEWVENSDKCRVLASFSPDKSGSGWFFVNKEPLITDGPHVGFGESFFERLKTVNGD